MHGGDRYTGKQVGAEFATRAEAVRELVAIAILLLRACVMGKTNSQTNREVIFRPLGDKDMQKSKLYAAENAFRWNLKKEGKLREFKTIEEMQGYVDRLLQRDYVRRRFFLDERNYFSGKHTLIHVRPGFGCRNAAARVGDVWTDHRTGERLTGKCVVMPEWSRNEVVLLHEVAHHLVGLDNEHNWPFVGGFVDLVQHMLGADAAKSLKGYLRRGKVRIFKPPVMPKLTPEQREAALANLQKAANRRAGGGG